MTSTSSLKGKRALVTGGSRGIGAAIVRRLASQGAAVAVLAQDGHLGATYELGGTPFTLTELAATMSDVLGTHIAYQDMSVADYTGALTPAGLPPEMAATVADADAGLSRGELFTASDDLETAGEMDTEVWFVTGAPSGEALVRAVAEVLDDLAEQTWAQIRG